MNAMTRLVRKALCTVATLALTWSMTSCDNMMYEKEKGCYTVRFVYDYNMKWADATAAEVETVTLHLIDPKTGKVVLTQTESGEQLARNNYTMTLDVDPGNYTLLVWAGSIPEHNSFDINATPAQKEQLGATLLNRVNDEKEKPHHYKQMDGLYYGQLPNQVFPPHTEEYTVHLMKDTNELQVVLQNLNGSPLNGKDFDFIVTDDNGRYDSDNNPLPDDTITYHAWCIDGDLVWQNQPTRTIDEYTAAVAEFTLPRLLDEHKETSRLKIIRRDTGSTIVDIPLIQALLLVKGYYNQSMTNQEFLDRQDNYSLTFFLDSEGGWYNAYIYILSWKVVWQTHSL